MCSLGELPQKPWSVRAEARELNQSVGHSATAASIGHTLTVVTLWGGALPIGRPVTRPSATELGGMGIHSAWAA